MPTSKLQLGKEAVIWVKLKFIHPSAIIREAFPNTISTGKLEDCVVLRQDTKKINRREKLLVVFTHPRLNQGENPTELYCVKRYAHVTTEGPKDYLFDAVVDGGGLVEQDAEGGSLAGIQHLLSQQAHFSREEIFEAEGVVEVDDDNLPLPENIPTTTTTTTTGVFNDEWGEVNLCNRKKEGISNTKPSLEFPRDVQPTKVQLFELLFPKDYVIEVFLPTINAQLEKDLVTYGKYLRWVGLWYLMATIQGPKRCNFWSGSPIDLFEGAPF